jgi:hypothetical protein
MKKKDTDVEEDERILSNPVTEEVPQDDVKEN